jgi:hypothetical protein
MTRVEDDISSRDDEIVSLELAGAPEMLCDGTS